MNEKKLKELEKRLAVEKQRLLETEAALIERGGLGEPMKDAFTELSAYDNHPGDAGSQLYERSKDLGLLQTVRREIAEVEEAQQAMELGSYGFCRSCGRSIPLRRLQALPRAALCVRCQREEEGRDLSGRPVEEEVLFPPFGRTFTDETDNVGFDGEDAWEAVARYGTSSEREEN